MLADVCCGSTEIWVLFFLAQQRTWQTSSVMWPGLITATRPRLRSDRAVRLRDLVGLPSEEMLLWGQWKESRAGPVKHAAGVSYRLDIHDHCQQCQSIYGHFERGLESESLCSVSGEGFLRENYFSFIFCWTLQCCSGDMKLVNRLINGLGYATVYSMVFNSRYRGFYCCDNMWLSALHSLVVWNSEKNVF